MRSVRRFPEDYQMSKEAMNLALEAFDSMVGRKPERVEQAITALREALAEQPAQRTWVSLTEDEISLIVAECSLVSPSDHYFAEAIEAKLRSKNT